MRTRNLPTTAPRAEKRCLKLVSEGDSVWIGLATYSTVHGIPCLTFDCMTPSEIDAGVEYLHEKLEKMRVAAHRHFNRAEKQRSLARERFAQRAGRTATPNPTKS